jgi:hypothetical protein
MAVYTTPQTRRAFSTWLAAGGFLLTTSTRGAAEDLFDSGLSVTDTQAGATAINHAYQPLSPEQYGQVSLERRSQDGRPPSEWLRGMEVEELRAWLADLEVPEAGVHGMTFWTHLTRDHMFQPLLIKGLSEVELAKLHAAAHFGY